MTIQQEIKTDIIYHAYVPFTLMRLVVTPFHAFTPESPKRDFWNFVRSHGN